MGRQFSALALARLTMTGLQAIAIVLLARLVSVADFGLIVTVITVQAVLMNIASFGIPTYILREYPRENFGGVHAALKLTGFSCAVGGALACILPLCFIGDRAPILWSVALLALGVTLDKITETRLSVSIARGSSRIPVASILLRSLLALGAFAVLVPLGIDPILAFGLGKALAGVVGVGQIMAFTRLPRPQVWVGQGDLMRSLWPLAGNSAISSLRMLDTVMVTALSGTGAAGLYAAASKFLSPFGLIAGVLSSVLMPKSSIMSADDARKLIWRIARYTGIGTLCLIPMSLLSEPAMVILFGAGFDEGAGGFTWIMLGLPASAAVPLVATILQAQGRERFVFVNAAVLSPSTLVAVAIGAATYGATGAGLGFAAVTWISAISLISAARVLRTVPVAQVPH